MKRKHLVFCYILWSVWFFGIFLLVISIPLDAMDTFIDSNIGHAFFWYVVEPYNRYLILLSLLPIEPIFFIITLIAELLNKEREKLFLTVILPFIITVILCPTYLCLFVALTGGV